jgi:hypothetical protein
MEKKNTSYNNNTEKIINVTSNLIRTLVNLYLKAQELVRNATLPIKISNVAVPMIITYIFTFVYYNLSLSLFFAGITIFSISLLSKAMAIMFHILYVITIINTFIEINSTLGKPISQTDIIKSGVPYNCVNTSLTVSNSVLEADLYGGYFTYSFWLYINNGVGTDTAYWNNYRYNEWKSIFYRGNAINSYGDLSSLIQFPGFWLTPALNNMVIVFQNGSYVERLEINDIPFNTWTNFSIVVETKSVSIYIDGNLDRTLNLYQNIVVMNAYNLYITSDMLTSKNKNESGFAGSLAELIYYNYALSSSDIIKSYNYYKKIIFNYQSKIYKQNTYQIPKLITN